ncbi:MAG: glycosyltransferase [Bacteroidaceae bacterium]|nr:glycosyltransferase [Bacteroidaceae bacterium]
MTKVAFIHNSFPAGGAERITIDIARHLSSRGDYEIFVFTTRLADSLMPDDVHKILTIRTIPSQAIQSRRSRHIERFIVANGIDILVSVGKSIYDIDGIRMRTGVKTILACHGEPFWQRHIITHRRQKGLIRRILWHTFNKRRFADGTLAMQMAITRTMKDYLQCDAYTVLCDSYRSELITALDIDPTDNHIHVIENPERPVDQVCYEKEKMILFCGRLENWSKRVDRLLRIWSTIQHQLPDWRLVIVGNGPANEMLREMAKELKLERISFEGRKRDVAHYYRKASIVCLTSETEGWPLALTEAQAQGCIGVAFGATSGIKEILSPHGECGFIVPRFNERAYADTLIHIAHLNEKEEYSIRRKSVEKRLQYAPHIIAEKWRVLFDSLSNHHA